MRRRRKPLEVSTFPFLAVLLCAMGSLILVLLVMDRKAKMAARAKAQATYASAAAETAKEADRAAAAHRAELDRRLQEMRADWQKKRDALHSKLLTEQQTLQLEMQQLHDNMIQAAARLRAEQEQTGEAKDKIKSEQGKLQGETLALTSKKAALDDTEKHTEQEKAALARMTNDLLVLELALKDLKAAREREKQTYSVVPYNGKHGENRRPLYIECTGPNVIFHPDKKALLVVVQRAEVRAEVERRVARQRQQLAEAHLSGEPTPYLMLLVRPDGIFSYYSIQSALTGMNVQFGYELIDEDWLLDFPPDNLPAATQPWQASANGADTKPTNAAAPGTAMVRGVKMQMPTTALPPLGPNPQPGGSGIRGIQGAVAAGRSGGTIGNDTGVSAVGGGLGRPIALGNDAGSVRGLEGGNVSGPPGPPRMPWEPVGSSNSPSGAPALRGVRSGTNDPISGTGPSGNSMVSLGTPRTGPLDDGPPGNGMASGGPSSGIPALPTTVAQGGGSPPTGMSVLTQGGWIPPPTSAVPGNRENGGGNPTGSREPSPDLPALPPAPGQGGAPNGVPNGPGGSGSGNGPSGGTPPDGAPPKGDQPPSTADPTARGSANGGSGNGPSGGTPPDGAPPKGDQPPSSGDPAARSSANGGTRNPGNSTGDPGDGSPQSGNSRSFPMALEPKRPAPPPLHAARLSGNRDYLIFIECKPDGVILYPAQQYYSLSELTSGPNNSLVQAVQLMIQRRQANVRAGETPYRPQVRFLIRPETLRAYHATYPLLQGLPLTQSRQDLVPEDDVRSIIAGR